VENGQYGVAIAYSSVLIVVMVTVIGLFQMLVGDRKIRRPIPAKNEVPA
jgi:iron(III) transport system permease protein